MGSGNSKKEHNPQPETNQEQKERESLQKYVQDTFRKAAANGILTKDKFNQVLAILEGANFKRMRDTPLADRLFYLFDKNKDGNISERDFIEGINEIVTDNNNAIMYSFRAFDGDEDNRISKREFVQFIEESWKSAYRILGEAAENTRKDLNLSLGDISNWAVSQVSALNDKTTNIFNSMDVNRTGFIDYISFKEWVTKSEMNSIRAELPELEVEVPIHYIKLRKS